jgi:hypothetical protein
MSAQMDNRFGGGHARHAPIQLLATDIAQLMAACSVWWRWCQTA